MQTKDSRGTLMAATAALVGLSGYLGWQASGESAATLKSPNEAIVKSELKPISVNTSESLANLAIPDLKPIDALAAFAEKIGGGVSPNWQEIKELYEFAAKGLLQGETFEIVKGFIEVSEGDPAVQKNTCQTYLAEMNAVSNWLDQSGFSHAQKQALFLDQDTFLEFERLTLVLNPKSDISLSDISLGEGEFERIDKKFGVEANSAFWQPIEKALNLKLEQVTTALDNLGVDVVVPIDLATNDQRYELAEYLETKKEGIEAVISIANAFGLSQEIIDNFLDRAVPGDNQVITERASALKTIFSNALSGNQDSPILIQINEYSPDKHVLDQGLAKLVQLELEK